MSREITRSKTLIVGGNCELETVAVTLNYTYSGSVSGQYIKYNWGILKGAFLPSYQVSIEEAQGSVTLNFVRAKGQTIHLGNNDGYVISNHLGMAGIPTCEGGVSIDLSTFVITITGDGVINMALTDTDAN